MDRLTSRERWAAVLQRQSPDRVPMDYWGTPEVTRSLMAYVGAATEDELFARLCIDRPAAVGPRYIGPLISSDADLYGCRYRDVDYGSGTYAECVFHPLAGCKSIAEIEATYKWPSAEWYDFNTIPQQIQEHAHRPIQLSLAGMYTQYTLLRGMEQAFVDYALNPELVRHCMNRMTDFHAEVAARSFATAGPAGTPRGIDIGMVANDMGSQVNLLFSPDTIRRLFLPGIRRLAELTHHYGAWVFLHSDGAIRRIIPELIEAGIDILNPIQWRARGMGREGLKRDFGSQLVFHGGVDNQETLVSGSPEDVRAEVRANIEVLGAGGGYILAPCHNIQPVSPVENIVAMYEEGYRMGQAQ